MLSSSNVDYAILSEGPCRSFFPKARKKLTCDKSARTSLYGAGGNGFIVRIPVCTFDSRIWTLDLIRAFTIGLGVLKTLRLVETRDLFVNFLKRAMIHYTSFERF